MRPTSLLLVAAVAVAPSADRQQQPQPSADDWAPARRYMYGHQCDGGGDSDDQGQCAAAAFGSTAGRSCTIDRVPWGSLSTDDFTDRYVAAGRPVILTAAAAGFLSRPADFASKKAFVQAFGELTVNVGTGAELAQFGGKNLFGSRAVTLAEVVAGFAQNGSAEGGATATAATATATATAGNDRAVFDMHVMKEPQMSSSFLEPVLFGESFMAIRGASWNMLSLGADGTGLGFHTHADTWLGLAAGAKRWLLFEPGAFPADDPLFPNRMLDAEQLMRHWPSARGNSSDDDDDDGDDRGRGGSSTGVARPMDCVQQAGEIMYLPAGWAHSTLNLGETVGVGGQTQTCEPPDGCKSLIKRLESAASSNKGGGGGGGALGDPESLRLMSHAHLLLGQGKKDRAHEAQVMFAIEYAFRLAPTMMGVAADVLNIFVQDNDVLAAKADEKTSNKKKKSKGLLSRRQRAALKAQRASELASAEADGYVPLHPALTLTERTIIPVLEASASQGVSARTLAASYWSTAEVLGKLAISPPQRESNHPAAAAANVEEVRDSARAVTQRLLEAGWEKDRGDIRFPRELAVQRGHARDWEGMRGYLDSALAIDPADPAARKMRDLLPG